MELLNYPYERKKKQSNIECLHLITNITIFFVWVLLHD